MTDTPASPARRRLVAGIGAVLVAGLPAPAFAAGAFRAVRVDTGPLAARGVPVYAATVRSVLEPLAAATVGARVDARDKRLPTLVIPVESIQMRASGGSSGRRSRRGGSDQAQDWIVGAGLVVAPNGAVLARHPITTSRDASQGGAWYLVEESERRRLQNLCESLVYWLAQKL